MTPLGQIITTPRGFLSIANVRTLLHISRFCCCCCCCCCCCWESRTVVKRLAVCCVRVCVCVWNHLLRCCGIIVVAIVVVAAASICCIHQSWYYCSVVVAHRCCIVVVVAPPLFHRRSCIGRVVASKVAHCCTIDVSTIQTLLLCCMNEQRCGA